LLDTTILSFLDRCSCMVMWQIQRQYFPTKLPFQQFNLFYHYYHNTICLGFLTDVKGGKIMTIIVTVTVLLVRWHLRTKHPIFFLRWNISQKFWYFVFFWQIFRGRGWSQWWWSKWFTYTAILQDDGRNSFVHFSYHLILQFA